MKNLILTLLLSLVIVFNTPLTRTIEITPSIYDAVYQTEEIDTLTITYNIALTKELEWATRLIQSEAMNESELGKIAVVQTILNRVEYNKFRKRKTDFFWEIRRPGQVDGYGTKNWRANLKPENIKIAYKALYGEQLIPETIYFWHNECISTDKKHVNDTEGPNGEYIYERIDNHTFCHGKRILENEEYLIYLKNLKTLM